MGGPQASRARGCKHRRQPCWCAVVRVVHCGRISVSCRLERLCVSTTLENAPVVMLHPTSQLHLTAHLALCRFEPTACMEIRSVCCCRTQAASISILTVPECEIREQEAIRRAGTIRCSFETMRPSTLESGSRSQNHTERNAMILAHLPQRKLVQKHSTSTGKHRAKPGVLYKPFLCLPCWSASKSIKFLPVTKPFLPVTKGDQNGVP